MTSGRNRGLVQTVLGPVPPSELGATTTHEHLYIDFAFAYRPCESPGSIYHQTARSPGSFDHFARVY